jgi:CheY-like chemotaxis protein
LFSTALATDLLTERRWIGAGWKRRFDGRQAMVEATAMGVQTTDRVEEAGRWNCVAEKEMLDGAETILFVEDEGFVREVTSQVLRSAGYRVLTAKNAAEAIHVFDQCSSEVELLLTDVVLPGETGRVLAAKLRQRNPELNILLVTGYAEQMRLQGCDREECLAKPFSSEALLRRVRQQLDRSRRGIGTEEFVRPVCDNA